MDKPIERKRYFINRAYQGTFLGQMIVITVVIGIIMYLVSYYFFDAIFKHAISVGLGNNSQFIRYLLDVHTQLIVAMLVAFVFIALLVIFYAVWHSHKIAGPLEKIRMALDGLADHQPAEEIRFRKTDYFHELAESYNRYVKNLAHEKK